MVIPAFGKEAEERMRDFFQSLNERDRRRYGGLGWKRVSLDPGVPHHP